MSRSTRTKLAGALALLSSNVDGEVLAAAAAAVRLMDKAGVTWGDLLLPADPPAAEPPLRTSGDRWPAQITICLNYVDLLTGWERRFIEGVRQRRWLTTAQAETLTKIAAEVVNRVPAGADA